jgi:hypothetical protein
MPSLKEAKRNQATRNQAYKVDIVFHESIHSTSQDLRRDIEEKSHCGTANIEFLNNKARLTLQGLYLKDILQ